MRIVIVISGLNFGGAETQVMALSRRLAAHGHSVVLYTLNINNPRAGELEGSGVQVVAVQKRSSFDPQVLWGLRRFLREFRADIVHGFLFDGDFYSRVAALGTGVVALNSERSDGYRHNLPQRIAHRLTRHLARGVVANSYAGAAFAAGLFDFPAERVHVVWNGIDLAAIDRRLGAARQDYKQEFFGDPGVRVACMVANVKEAKDYALALETADLLTRRDPRWRVLFVGDVLRKVVGQSGPYQQAILAQYEQLGLAGRALFSGIRSDVVEILQGCDVLFSTSLREGFPNVVLEAMACGTPVVSTEYSDIRRILPDPQQVIGERSAAALVQGIEQAYARGAELRALQRRWVEQHATIDKSASRLETIYQQYLA